MHSCNPRTKKQNDGHYWIRTNNSSPYFIVDKNTMFVLLNVYADNFANFADATFIFTFRCSQSGRNQPSRDVSQRNPYLDQRKKQYFVLYHAKSRAPTSLHAFTRTYTPSSYWSKFTDNFHAADSGVNALIRHQNTRLDKQIEVADTE